VAAPSTSIVPPVKAEVAVIVVGVAVADILARVVPVALIPDE